MPRELKTNCHYLPTTGVRADFKRLMNEFLAVSTVRYEQFSEIWRRRNMSYLCAGRSTDREAREFLERVIQIAQEYFFPPFQFQVRVGGLYLLYAIYQIQPLQPKVKIRVTPTQWKDTVYLQQQAAQQDHLDVVYVFNRLLQEQAFYFCFTATEMRLYGNTDEEDDNETNLAEDLKEEKRSINKLFNYESMEQLSYLQDQYQQMKIGLAGPMATKPDKSLDVVHNELVDDLVVLLQSFKEKVASTLKKGKTNEETSSEQTATKQETSGGRRQMLKAQAYSQITATSSRKTHKLVVMEPEGTSAKGIVNEFEKQSTVSQEIMTPELWMPGSKRGRPKKSVEEVVVYPPSKATPVKESSKMEKSQSTSEKSKSTYKVIYKPSGSLMSGVVADKSRSLCPDSPSSISDFREIKKRKSPYEYVHEPSGIHVRSKTDPGNTASTGYQRKPARTIIEETIVEKQKGKPIEILSTSTFVNSTDALNNTFSASSGAQSADTDHTSSLTDTKPCFQRRQVDQAESPTLLKVKLLGQTKLKRKKSGQSESADSFTVENQSFQGYKVGLSKDHTKRNSRSIDNISEKDCQVVREYPPTTLGSSSSRENGQSCGQIAQKSPTVNLQDKRVNKVSKSLPDAISRLKERLKAEANEEASDCILLDDSDCESSVQRPGFQTKSKGVRGRKRKIDSVEVGEASSNNNSSSLSAPQNISQTQYINTVGKKQIKKVNSHLLGTYKSI